MTKHCIVIKHVCGCPKHAFRVIGVFGPYDKVTSVDDLRTGRAEDGLPPEVATFLQSSPEVNDAPELEIHCAPLYDVTGNSDTSAAAMLAKVFGGRDHD